VQRPDQARRFPTPPDSWDFLTITTVDDIADMITFTRGPKPAAYEYYPWVTGVTLLRDKESGAIVGSVIALSRLKARTITLPLRVIRLYKPQQAP
jgi:hypothetical protein